MIKISANVHAFDYWENEEIYLIVNGNKVWSKMIPNTKGINICG